MTKNILSVYFAAFLIPLMLLAMIIPLFADAQNTFGVKLNGDQQVPAVETEASGTFDLDFNSVTSTSTEAATSTDSATTSTTTNNEQISTEADFTLHVQNATSVTQAHLHCAPEGENGPPIVPLFGMIEGGFDVDGELASFTITSDNVLDAGATCSTPVTDIETLKSAVNNGEVYVNVHSVDYPNGLIRGQLSTSTDDNGDDDEDNEDDPDLDNDVEGRIQLIGERIQELFRDIFGN